MLGRPVDREKRNETERNGTSGERTDLSFERGNEAARSFALALTKKFNTAHF